MTEPGPLTGDEIRRLAESILKFLSKNKCGVPTKLSHLTGYKDDPIKIQAGLGDRKISGSCWEIAWARLLEYPGIQRVKGIGNKDLILLCEGEEREKTIMADLKSPTKGDRIAISDMLVELIKAEGPMEMSRAIDEAARRLGFKPPQGGPTRSGIARRAKGSNHYGDDRSFF